MLTLTIETLGAQGDGIARRDGRALFVPFTLPGERVEAQVEGHGERARLEAVLDASPSRQEAPCPHFGGCGGCDLQHADAAFYAGFKRDLVSDALAARGLKVEVGALVPCAPATRRRAVFSAIRVDSGIALGFYEADTHRIASIEVCLVVVPEIAARLDDFRALALLAADRKRPLRMTVTATPSGLDIAIVDAATLTENMRRQIVAFGLKRDFARVTLGEDVLMETRKPLLDMAGIAVVPPPGAFLQAVASAESAMAALVSSHFGKAKAVADLFCGIGTFTFPLARAHAVHAVEFEAQALAALDHARRGVSGLKPITTERRDLFRRPVTAKELSKFQGVVFDPPRAGAEAQVREIAASKVAKVAAVSCNQVTLARDLGILVDAGFSLSSVTPIDQFLWSHHVEAVALLER